MADDSSRLGELLVKEDLITPLQLKKAMDSQRSRGGRLGHELTKLGYIDEIVRPEETRPRIIQALEMLANKRDVNPPKKHGNIPL